LLLLRVQQLIGDSYTLLVSILFFELFVLLLLAIVKESKRFII
jgi:hypothetical protein